VRPLSLDDLVVGIEQAVVAPLATRRLADLGARAIKIERPEGVDFARRSAPTPRTSWPRASASRKETA
jgi:crotonobetainyl-CoA:carnitine CoA-transferase CaiB-like acyl-CoA transferase